MVTKNAEEIFREMQQMTPRALLQVAAGAVDEKPALAMEIAAYAVVRIRQQIEEGGK